MQEEEAAQPNYTDGGDETAGKSFDPSELKDDEGSPAESPAPKFVPVGRPVSEAQFRQMKEQAGNDERPSEGRHAQEDPARRGRDG